MSNLTRYVYNDGVGSGVGNVTLLLKPYLCTIKTCDLNMSNFLYIPSLAGNAALVAIFGAFLIGQLGFGIKFKTWGYMIAMSLGLVLEIIGYYARIQMHNNPFNGDAFLMYLVTLTIAPALMTASIYLCLGRIVNIYGSNLSRFKPRTYTIVFCTFDLICLVLQAIGGGLASTADTKKQGDVGKNIMIAGLICQVIALSLFIFACAEYASRVWKGRGYRNQNYAHIASSKRFKAFLVGLGTATIAIQTRCIYRCVELWGGFNSDLFVDHEATYMILEGGMIGLACLCLTVLHPGICFQGAWGDANFNLRNKNGEKGAMQMETRSGSDVESLQAQKTPFTTRAS